MDLLQIGLESWIGHQDRDEHYNWYYTRPENLVSFLEELKAERLAKLPPQESGMPEPVIHLQFGAVLLTSSIEEALLEVLAASVEAYAVFCSEGVQITDQMDKGFYQRKRPQVLPSGKTPEEQIAFLEQIIFSGQYGAKLKIDSFDISPRFKGRVQYKGHSRVQFDGDFGEDFQQLYTYHYNLSAFNMALELWQEYDKLGDCQIKIEIIPMRKGSLYDMLEPIIVEEEQLDQPIILPPNEEVGFYSVSILARGRGILEFGVMHWRYSRQGYGTFIFGGKRDSDAKKQEFISYFNPGDMKPPLTVYFSAFRGAEGFEGFYMMKSLKTPFMLIGDPRLEGGSFYIGSEEFEEKLQGRIQEALDYLGFDGSQMILSGLSMGTFGALYYASRFNPYGIVVGKPFTNLGDTVRGMRLKRPDEFETIGDVFINSLGTNSRQLLESLNQKFWDKFSESDFLETKFAIAYMKNDDYDGTAAEKLIEHLSPKKSHIFAQGYSGRHNDDSRSINKWFMSEYVKMLREGFDRFRKDD
ncbi:accessory Sec system protein Asp2 [Streptococcus uberis]|uniref:accessory Sec system protein Asp2 n=1 Tax=Streptococcus uberis TaxID=1349 RepID=UPI0012B61D17|nr:accessory Sec system protein Asp2 [Streptococcus uberis]MTB57707.1 accessory Sec system protein Asp2 [Streptococcus uberis]